MKSWPCVSAPLVHGADGMDIYIPPSPPKKNQCEGEGRQILLPFHLYLIAFHWWKHLSPILFLFYPERINNSKWIAADMYITDAWLTGAGVMSDVNIFRFKPVEGYIHGNGTVGRCNLKMTSLFTNRDWHFHFPRAASHTCLWNFTQTFFLIWKMPTHVHFHCRSFPR